MTAADDRLVCRDMLPRVSRTFALSIEALPESLREPVRVAYLLCRVVDTIENELEVPQAERALRFDTFDELLPLALATLDELETSDDTLRPGRTPKVSRRVVADLIQKAAGADDDDRALADLLDHRPRRRLRTA